MARFRRKPAVVDAVQFRADAPIDEWPEGVDADAITGEAMIETLEGPLMVSDGDWIVTGIAGEKYPVKPAYSLASMKR